MFDQLSDRLAQTLKHIRGQGRLTDRNIQDTLREVRLSLLEADVNFRVVKAFVKEVKKRALGHEVMRSLSPGQQFVKIVYEELASLMGGSGQGLDLKAKPPVPVMLVGLQGSGKTTTSAKLALKLKKEGRRPYLVPADVQRPAAIEQLQKLASDLGIPAHPTEPGSDPVSIAADAKHEAELHGYDVVIVDTAGRLQIDTRLMEELERMKAAISPREILLVADAMTGQDAVNIAEEFDKRLELTGVILTKLDGDARGGAALSIRAVTKKPIKFVGVGERADALDVFHPERMAQRILGMGDMLSLIERAQETYDEDKAVELGQKLYKDEFTLEDFLYSLQQLKKMGSMEDMLKMIPGVGGQLKKMKNMQPPEEELRRIEAIIHSMTKQERNNHRVLNASRRARIARGSGTRVQDVNQFLRHYMQTRKMMKKMTRMGMRGAMSALMGGRL